MKLPKAGVRARAQAQKILNDFLDMQALFRLLLEKSGGVQTFTKEEIQAPSNKALFAYFDKQSGLTVWLDDEPIESLQSADSSP